jgi:hypothetical protein
MNGTLPDGYALLFPGSHAITAGSGAGRAYLETLARQGQRLGDIKPAILTDRIGWSEVFRGRWLPGPA